MKVLCLLLSFILLLSGCQTAVPAETEGDPGIITDFTFSLPDGYVFEEGESNSLTILKNGESIGALVLTSLDPSCVKDTGNTDVHKYVNTYGPIPMICEYIIMQGDSFLSISMAVTDPETDVRTETSHRLFAHEGKCFDLWFYWDILDDDERFAITKGICSSPQ